MFARIVGGGICIMSPAAARQTRTAQSAADGKSWRSETPDDDAQTCGGSRRNHVGGAARPTIPIDDSSGTIIRHLAVADRTGELPPSPPVGRKGAERQPTGTGIAFGKGIGTGGTAGHDFDIGKTAHKKPIEIGSQPIEVRKRTRTSDDEFEHSGAPPHFESAEPPRAEASAELFGCAPRKKTPVKGA